MARATARSPIIDQFSTYDSAPEGYNNSALVRWRAIGVPALARRRNRHSLAILMFHDVEMEPLSPTRWHVLDVSRFSHELAYVNRYFHVLPLEEAQERLAAGTLPTTPER